MDAVARLGGLLLELGFGGERHVALASFPGGSPSSALLDAVGRPEDARLSTLLALFCSGEPVALARAVDALPPDSVDELAEAGLLGIDVDGVRASFLLAAAGNAVVAGDPDAEWGRADFVAGVSPAGLVTAYATVQRPVAVALDLGTGSGILALLAARHAEQVVAIDLNPHALELARLGGRLSRVANVEWVEGDWEAPVRGRRFGLVVCNPPLAISPDVAMLARDSEVGGEAIGRRMVAESAGLLEEGGFATVLCAWAHDGDAWEERPREWVRDLGCDAVLIHLGSDGPLSHAMTHVGGRLVADREAMAASVERWMRYYAAEGIERIALGIVVLRRRGDGVNWVRAVGADQYPNGPGGAQLERMFAGGDFLASPDSRAALLASRWTAVDGLRLEQPATFGEDGYSLGDLVLRQPGLNVSARIDARAAPVVVGCDGTAAIGELIARTGVAASPSVCLDAISELIARGFLTRA